LKSGQLAFLGILVRSVAFNISDFSVLFDSAALRGKAGKGTTVALGALHSKAVFQKEQSMLFAAQPPEAEHSDEVRIRTPK
jgi:hypothetical protein